MIIPHAQLGQIGVVGDQNGQALPVNAWTDSLNVRFTNLGIEKIAEATLRLDTPAKLEIFTTKRRYGKVYLFGASDGGLHVYNGETWQFTPAAKQPDEYWQFTHWGDTVIFNCPSFAPFMFDWDAYETNLSALFTPLPKWGMISTTDNLENGEDPSFDTELRCQRLLSYKSQLVAVGVSYKEPVRTPVPDRDPIYAEEAPEKYDEEEALELEDGDQWYVVTDPEFDYEDPSPDGLTLKIWNGETETWDNLAVKSELLEKDNVVWVSDTTADPTYKVPEGAAGGGADAGVTGAVAGGPPSWDYVSPATLSVQQVVGASDGRYVAAELLNEAVIIYTATAAHALVFTGGQYVVQTRRLFQRGCAGRQCVVEFSGNHFVVDGDQLYIHDGSQATRVGEDMFDVEFFKRAVNLNSATLCHDPENREIWIYFDTKDGRKSCIYSYATGTFGWGDGEAGGSAIQYASRGFLPSQGAQWGDMVGPWRDYTEPKDAYIYPVEESLEGSVSSDEIVFENYDFLGWYEEPVQNWRFTSYMELPGEGGNLANSFNQRVSFSYPLRCSNAKAGDSVRFKCPIRINSENPQSYGYNGSAFKLSIYVNDILFHVTEGSGNVYDIGYDQRPTFFVVRDGWDVENLTIKHVIESPLNQWLISNPVSGIKSPRVTVSAYSPSYYSIGELTPEYQQSTWRWIDQTTLSDKPKVLALTTLGVHQKEAFFATSRDCWVERTAIDLDDAGMNGWVIKHLKQYHMQLAGEGKVGIRTGWADSALASPSWEKPTWLDENGDGSYQADMRTTGRYLSLRFEFKEMAEFRWANGYMDIEVSGRR